MQSIYKIIEGSGGRCSCGHRQRIGDPYYLVETNERAHTLCKTCGKERGLDRWWGTKAEVTAEEMAGKWFGGEPIKEVVCRQLKPYIRKLGNSQKKEEMLRVAVDV